MAETEEESIDVKTRLNKEDLKKATKIKDYYGLRWYAQVLRLCLNRHFETLECLEQIGGAPGTEAEHV